MSDLVPTSNGNTDVATTDHSAAAALSLQDQWQFAEQVASSGMVPKAYRGDPGGVLLAINLGQQMGLSPAESLYRIHVIEGKPSASAELIASNVRKAGHKIRIQATNEQATVRITRADDPDDTSEITWTWDDATRAELTGKDNWRKYPRAMLRARAISECAREACPEALYGVTYVDGEVVASSYDDSDGVTTGAVARESAADVLQQSTTEAPQQTEAEAGITSSQQKRIGTLMREASIADRDMALRYVADVIGREIGSRKELSVDEADKVIVALESEASADPNTGEIDTSAAAEQAS